LRARGFDCGPGPPYYHDIRVFNPWDFGFRSKQKLNSDPRSFHFAPGVLLVGNPTAKRGHVMRISYQHSIIIILLLSGLLVFGCSNDSDLLRPEPGAYKFSASPDILMENFQKAYTAMDLDGYGHLLHEEFIFSFQACDVEKLGLSKDHFTREDELITAEHMFARKA
jgi:hypothetical protein